MISIFLFSATWTAAKETSPPKKGEQVHKTQSVGILRNVVFQIESGVGEVSNKTVGRIELLTPRPFTSNICTRDPLVLDEGPSSKPVPSQFIRPLLYKKTAPRCVFYALFTRSYPWDSHIYIKPAYCRFDSVLRQLTFLQKTICTLHLGNRRHVLITSGLQTRPRPWAAVQLGSLARTLLFLQPKLPPLISLDAGARAHTGRALNSAHNKQQAGFIVCLASLVNCSIYTLP